MNLFGNMCAAHLSLAVDYTQFASSLTDFYKVEVVI